MAMDDRHLQQMPSNAGNAETMLACARVFRDWLSEMRGDEHPTRVLKVMVDATISALEKGQTPPALDGAWIVEQFGKRIDGERSASSLMNWSRVETYFQTRRNDLAGRAASQQLGLLLLPVQLSVGKRGVSSTYGWRVEPIQSEELASSEPARTDAAIYSRHLDADPSWLVSPFFPNGVMHIKSWRGVLVFVLILTAALIVAMYAWAVTAVIGTPGNSAVDAFSLFIVLLMLLWVLWSALLRPVFILIDDRIGMTPSTLNLLSTEVDGQWEFFREGDQRWVQLVRYTAPCPRCGATLRLAKGEPDWRRRLVGRCAESPREHVYSFDRVTLRGERLR